MPTTEIPPRSPVPPPHPAPSPDGGDLYDARRWETAYREAHDVPLLLIQLQDDLSRSRQREAFWISVVVHLVIVILIVNSPKFEKYLPKRAVMVVSPHDWMRQKELTYLEMPPDEQKVTKRPDANIISDKNRIATSRTPQINREELKKILDSARAGAPGPGGSPMQPPTPPAVAQGTPAQEQQPQAQPPSNPGQTAKVQYPSTGTPKPSFKNNQLSPGSAIDQAARAAAANRGGYGESGDYGLGQGIRSKQTIGPLEILTDTMGVDFGPYLARVLHDVRQNWYNLIPEAARPPLMKKGKVSIQFAIMKDGTVQGMTLISPSGDTALDRGAWGGITASEPFPPLPKDFGGQYLGLRFTFYYNPDKSDLQ
jgi:TonB family protein